MISTLITDPIIQVVKRRAPSLEISKILAYVSVLIVVGLKKTKKRKPHFGLLDHCLV